MTSNKQLLDDYIEKSGLKIGFICEKLGITRQAFGQKRRNITSFKAAEVYVLCAILNIPENEKSQIFLP